MGGSAFILPGALAPTRAEPSRTTFWGRRFGESGTKRFQVGNVVLIEVPSGKLEPLVESYRQYLRAQLAHPWPASGRVLNYLQGMPPRLCLSGLQEDGNVSWTLHMSFSGSAGMADISAAVAAHWAERWFGAQRAGLERDLLHPFGFTPAEPEENDESFLPAGDYGYALFKPEGRPDIKSLDESYYFELDGAAYESMKTRKRALLRQLDLHFTPFMQDGRCRCQVCMPELDISNVSQAFA